MSAIRNYRRSLSERRESLSEMYHQDALKRMNEIAANSAGADSRNKGCSSDEDDDVDAFSDAKTSKPKDRQRKFSLDFIFARKNKGEKKKERSQSTSGPSTDPTVKYSSSAGQSV